MNYRKFKISSKCPHKYFIRSGIYNFCPEMIAFVVKINSRLIIRKPSVELIRETRLFFSITGISESTRHNFFLILEIFTARKMIFTQSTHLNSIN